MAVNYAISQKAPALPIDVGKDFMFALGKCSAAHGGKAMSQQGLKFLQAIAIGHSALAVKEADKMSVQQRDRAAAKCMQEIAVPGLIKTIELALDSAAEPLPMPFRWQDHLYVTTLGLGKVKAKTFMETPATVFTKFKAIKADFTKVWLWLDTNNKNTPKDLPSGTNTQDSLEELNDAMWFETDLYKREKAKQDAEAEAVLSQLSAGRANPDVTQGAAGSADPAPTPPAGAGGPEALVALAAAGAGPAALAALAATAVRQEGASRLAAAAAANVRQQQEQEQQERDERADEVPDGWCFVYLLLTAAYSAWSGQAPSECTHLDSSDGPPRSGKRKSGCTHLDSSDGPPRSGKRKSGDVTSGDVTIDADNPVCSPAAMSRLNPNGDAVTRRQHAAAVKREKELERKAAGDKELQDARKESLETKKKGLAALEAANTHVESIGANLKRMVELKEDEAAGKKRETKIRNLRQMLELSLGNEEKTRAELLVLFAE